MKWLQFLEINDNKGIIIYFTKKQCHKIYGS